MGKHSAVGTAIRDGLTATLSPIRKLGVSFPKRLTRHLQYRGVVKVSISADRAFQMRSFGHAIENNLYWYGVSGHEPETFLPWLEAAKTASVVLDIGANTGLFSLGATAQNPDCRAFAFEPLPRVANIIRENAALNPGARIEVCQVAVSDQSGVVMIHDPGGDQPASASLRSDFLVCETEPVEVQAVRIDDFVEEQQLKTVDLIKLDVEGVEELALRGMRQTMERHRPHLFMEFLDDRPELAEEIAHLMKSGYKAIGLTRSGPTLLDAPTADRCERNLLLTTQPDAFLNQA